MPFKNDPESGGQGSPCATKITLGLRLVMVPLRQVRSGDGNSAAAGGSKLKKAVSLSLYVCVSAQYRIRVWLRHQSGNNFCCLTGQNTAHQHRMLGPTRNRRVESRAGEPLDERPGEEQEAFFAVSGGGSSLCGNRMIRRLGVWELRIIRVVQEGSWIRHPQSCVG